MPADFDARPIIVALAGPNGAGKSTYYHAHLARAGLRFVNADEIARELAIDSYQAAEVAEAIRGELCASRESFVFETVFSDPVGAKVAFLLDAVKSGYTVILCFIGLPAVETSEERVAMRVLQGGHDVPQVKLAARLPRILNNLERAIATLPHVLVYDNGDLRRPFRQVAEFENGRAIHLDEPPSWCPRP